MINECTEFKFKNCLNELIKSYSGEIGKDKTFKHLCDFSDFEIELESLNLIRVQFRALGLICLSEKKRTASDRNTYWKLTPYGDYVMTQLLAIKKDEK